MALQDTFRSVPQFLTLKDLSWVTIIGAEAGKEITKVEMLLSELQKKENEARAEKNNQAGKGKGKTWGGPRRNWNSGGPGPAGSNELTPPPPKKRALEGKVSLPSFF